MMSEWSIALSVALLALVALVTRVSGAFLMAWVNLTPKLERFLEGLAVSVIAALVASLLATGDSKTVVATFAALAVMTVSHSVTWAMLVGMLVAATYFYLLAP